MNVKTIICGGDQTYIVNEDGSMYSSGDNRFGQLSHGDYENTNKLELVVFKEKPSSESVIHGILDTYGTVTSVPNINYNITDADIIDVELSVAEYIDNSKVWEGNIKNGTQRTFNISNFDKLTNGEHSIKIEVKDRQHHLVTKTSKFIKFVTNPSEITIEKSDYGKKYNDFDISFKIFDKDKEDKDKLTIKYFMDENLIETKSNISNDISITYKIKFDSIKDGRHNLRIMCTDTQTHNTSKIIKFEKITKYKYDKYTIKNEIKGEYITTIIDDDGKYPDNGPKDGYWYVKGEKYIPLNEKDSEKLDENSVPIISGTNSYLGSKHTEFSIPYTVTDNDSIDDTISIQEKIDDKIIKIHSVKNGNSNNMTVTDEILRELSLNRHTCYIIATDKQNHVVIRTYEFTRDLDLRIEFTNKNFDLGTKDNEGFDLEYKILGSENHKYFVVERINEKDIIINKFEKTGDSTNVLHVTKDVIKKIKNGEKYTLSVNATLGDYSYATVEQKKFIVKYNEIMIRNMQDNYGSHIDSFNISYKVSNEYYDSLSCFEYIDNNQVWAGTLANNVSRNFLLNFDNIEIGHHDIKIVAIDKKGVKTERFSEFTKIDKSLLSNNRFGMIPLSQEKRDAAVPNELMMDSSSGHVYVKNPFGDTISKTEELEKLIYWCIQSLYTINTDGAKVSKVKEAEQLIDSAIKGIYPNTIDDDPKLKTVDIKTDSVIEKLKKVSYIGNKEPSTDTIIWIDTNEYVIKTYIDGKWEILFAGWV